MGKVKAALGVVSVVVAMVLGVVVYRVIGGVSQRQSSRILLFPVNWKQCRI